VSQAGKSCRVERRGSSSWPLHSEAPNEDNAHEISIVCIVDSRLLKGIRKT
jgi:hypothetical protein